MNNKKPAQKNLLEIFDYQDGFLYWKKTRVWNARKGTRAGFVFTSEGYRSVKINRKRYLEHHVIWCLLKGQWPSSTEEIDHINRNPTDNRIENLRLVDRTTNSRNRKGKGYSKTKNGKYQARIVVNKRFINLGLYETAKEAENKYLEAKAIYHGDCFVDSSDCK